MIADNNGNLYGTTQYGPGGGTDPHAILYKLAPSGGGYTITILHTFCPNYPQACTDGQLPMGPLRIDSAGELWGTTNQGGTHGDGEIFQFPGTLFVIHNFCSLAGCADGVNPEGGVTLDANGNIYGSANSYAGGGTGVVFELGNSFQVLYTFCPGQSNGCADGQEPWTGVILDGSGNLYGTTRFGGTYSGGVLFELMP